MDVQAKTELKEVFGRAGLSLSEETAAAFLCYYDLLIERNKVMNLTAITDRTDVFVKHFLDSAYLWKALSEAGVPILSDTDSASNREPISVIDVGTGAGFPGVPLKLMRPEIDLCLLDALNKRIGFLNEVKTALGLPNVTTVHARSEDAAAPSGALREGFSLAVSRAVSQLPVLSEYCLPFIQTGGLFIAYKAGEPEEEIKTAGHALDVLGGSLEQVITYVLPGTDLSRSLLVIRKIRETPKQYPRKAGKPEKKPL